MIVENKASIICPFCGSKKTIVVDYSKDVNQANFYCKRCKIKFLLVNFGQTPVVFIDETPLIAGNLKTVGDN